MKTIAAFIALGLVALPARADEPASSSSPAPKITTQNFSGWVNRCETAMTDGKPGRTQCGLVQDVTVREKDKMVPAMSIGFTRAEDGKGHLVTLRLPLGVQLKPGVTVAADDGAAESFAFYACGPRGCWVNGAPADGLLKTLKSGKTGRARVTFADGRPLAIEFPLAGLADGLAALDDATKDTAPQKPKLK